MENIAVNSDVLIGYVYIYGPKLVASILTLVFGLWLANFLVSMIRRMLNKSKVDPSLQSFLSSLFGILFKVMVYITALGVLGVEMTSFVAILGAAGLAVGLALSGTLQNFAGGVMILFFKTLKVGDFIEAQGYSGTVKEIQIFVTVLTTPDNKTIIVPNGPLSTGTLINYSSQATRRVDWTFGIAYGDDVDKAFALLKELIEGDARVLKDPEPFMAVSALADSSVNLVVRVWVNAPDYWAVFFRMNEEVYKRFPGAGLNIPFPQRDVHLYQK
jgi:small conductance mechanosensitive channel